jgi:hypothetical protein
MPPRQGLIAIEMQGTQGRYHTFASIKVGSNFVRALPLSEIARLHPRKRLLFTKYPFLVGENLFLILFHAGLVGENLV